MISTGASKVSYLPERPNIARRLLIEPNSFAWQDAAVARLEELVRLEKGWDGYSASPVSLANAAFALQMLEVICGVDSAPPQIVPGFEGDLQIEWHTLKGDVELHVKAPNDVHAWRFDCEGGAEEELDLRNDFLVAAQWVNEVSEHPIAFAAAAA